MVRAWDTLGLLGEGSAAGAEAETGVAKRKRIIVAPAMNTAMWRHPITKKQIKVLEEEWGISDHGENSLGDQGWFELLHPQEKELACGDVGDGAMKDWQDIVQVIEQRLGLNA